jgi:hypothetical protein
MIKITNFITEKYFLRHITSTFHSESTKTILFAEHNSDIPVTVPVQLVPTD